MEEGNTHPLLVVVQNGKKTCFPLSAPCSGGIRDGAFRNHLEGSSDAIVLICMCSYKQHQQSPWNTKHASDKITSSVFLNLRQINISSCVSMNNHKTEILLNWITSHNFLKNALIPLPQQHGFSLLLTYSTMFNQTSNLDTIPFNENIISCHTSRVIDTCILLLSFRLNVY